MYGVCGLDEEGKCGHPPRRSALLTLIEEALLRVKIVSLVAVMGAGDGQEWKGRSCVGKRGWLGKMVASWR
jgi:hypothetical protein